MKISVSQLRQIIREEVSRVQRNRALREAIEDAPGLVLVNGKLRAQTDPNELRMYAAREATPEEVRELDAALREPRPAGVSARQWNREIDDRFMAWQVWGPWDGVVQPSYVSRSYLK